MNMFFPQELVQVVLRHCSLQDLHPFLFASKAYRSLAMQELHRRLEPRCVFVEEIAKKISKDVEDSHRLKKLLEIAVIMKLKEPVLNRYRIFIIRAASRGAHQSLKILLKFPGVTLEHAFGYWSSALTTAVQRGHAECLRLLLALPGVTLQHVCISDKRIFRYVAYNKTPHCLEQLLAFPGVTPEHVRVHDNAAVLEAAFQGRTQNLKLLVIFWEKAVKITFSWP